jgi:hypothetical protein
MATKYIVRFSGHQIDLFGGHYKNIKEASDWPLNAKYLATKTQEKTYEII